MPILSYSLLLVAAFALLAVIFDPKDRSAGAKSTHVLGFGLEPGGEGPALQLTAQAGGVVTVCRRGVPLAPGESLCLVATLGGDGRLRLVEKKGVRSAGPESPLTATVTLRFLAQRTYDVRYESEVTGQWCTFELCNVDGHQVAPELKL